MHLIHVVSMWHTDKMIKKPRIVTYHRLFKSESKRTFDIFALAAILSLSVLHHSVSERYFQPSLRTHSRSWGGGNRIKDIITFHKQTHELFSYSTSLMNISLL